MAPKPRPIQRRLSSAAANGNPLQKTPNPQAMPPPPVPASVPAPPPPPRGILVPEATALDGCFRSAVVKTGEIYRFYSDTKKLAVQRYAPYPPRTIVSALGREVEKYDQLCDAIQSQLERAITVLQRDLKREQDRLKAAAAEAEAAARAAAVAAAASETQEPTQIPPAQEGESSTLSPTTPSARGPGLSARRQSTISLSSLQRPSFPHKLDLSAAALRLDPNDPMLNSGMASPVTLAPKSSLPRATEFTFDPSQPVDIDLTLGDDVPSADNDVSLGSSADKPIELDLDLDMDIFGDASGGAGLTGGDMGLANAATVKQEEPVDLDLFSGLPPEDAAKADAALLAAAQSLPPDAFAQAQDHISGMEQSSHPILDVFSDMPAGDNGKAPDNFARDFAQLQQLLGVGSSDVPPAS